MLCLIALPWSAYERPSAALGALAAYVKAHAPEIPVVCRSAFVEVALEIGLSLYEGISLDAYDFGELLYMPMLYPERREIVRDHLASAAASRDALWQLDNHARFPVERYGGPPTWTAVFERLMSDLDAHLDALVAEVVALEPRPRVVGLTTSFGQLFANLAFAQRLARVAPDITIVLGGSTVSSRVGPSLLREYEFVDYVIQGEGEQPLLALLRALAAEATPEAIADIPGLLARGGASSGAARLHEVDDMDALPLPDYDEYAALAEKHGLLWLLSIEGSRGCWWDRSRRSGNARATCHFCNLNVQWMGYREKSVARLVAEVEQLGDRYGNGAIFFLDNIIRTRGVEQFAEALIETERDLTIFYEMRANIRPYELLRLWEAGLSWVQFGIEGLSTRMLERIGKGTTTIANLQVMKICHELGIRNNANILTDFPGSTQAEVEETLATIQRHALAYEPLSANRFWLGRGATVEVLREHYPITRIRNADFYAVGLPPEVGARLELFDLSYDVVGEPADWRPVHEACAAWREAYEAARASEYRHLMTYFDGGTFVRIYDMRSGELASLVLRDLARDLYLFCAQIRTRSEVERVFAGADVGAIEGWLDEWDARGLLVREGERLLSLAPAFTPALAARRLRAAHRADLERRSESGVRTGGLRVLG